MSDTSLEASGRAGGAEHPDVEGALVRRLAGLFADGTSTDLDTVDTEASFFSPSFRVGGRALESMDVVELLAVLEEELGVPILEAADERGIDSVRGLADLVRTSCPPERLGAFCRAWPGAA